MNNFNILWTKESEKDIDAIYDFYFEKSPKYALEIIAEIIFETEKLVFSEQYQLDDINPNYRRIIVGHYKILYRICENLIVIFSVFDCRSNPKKLINLKE